MARFVIGGIDVTTTTSDEVNIRNSGHSDMLVAAGDCNCLLVLETGQQFQHPLDAEGTRIAVYQTRSLVTELLMARAPLFLIEMVEAVEQESGVEAIVYVKVGETTVYPD
jgi:hypothetical protein